MPDPAFGEAMEIDYGRLGPKDKPRVERAMPYVRDSFWSGRTFTSFDEIVQGAWSGRATSRRAGATAPTA
jgi:hypothetical protein